MSAWLFAGFMVALAVWLAWAQFYGGRRMSAAAGVAFLALLLLIAWQLLEGVLA